MTFNAPKAITFWIAAILAILGLLSGFGIFTILPIPAISLVGLGWLILAAGNVLSGL